MNPSTPAKLRIGAWCADPASGQISRNQETIQLEVRTMRLLLCLAGHPGEVVSTDDLLNQVWAGVTVSQDSVYQAVASLRRALGDDPKQPTYIATVPRLGYRMVAKVSPWVEEPVAQSNSPMATSGSRLRIASIVGGAAIFLALAFAFLFHGKPAGNHRTTIAAAASQSQKSIAVLPFLDLTQGMKEEEFADGMTEELIDKLSKIQGLRIPPPTSSFYFKGKQVPVAEIAKTLGVAYVLDGSVRKSHDQVRVAARLVRAENGYVIWSETYDRPFNDILMVQDDIASQVTKALQASIE
jgi:TolB-like protein/DNA-binding winged helix-turn-helix (wHTH) protein